MDFKDSKKYTIAEVARDIGISKATVYNKIQDFQVILKSHIKVVKGIKYLDLKALQIIKDSIGVSKIKNKQLETLETVSGNVDEIRDSG